jgi:hypothetical protein
MQKRQMLYLTCTLSFNKELEEQMHLWETASGELEDFESSLDQN